MRKLTTLAAIAALSSFAASANAGSYGGHCAPAAPICAPTYLQHSGQYVTQTYAYWTQAPISVQPVTHVQRSSNCGTSANCKLTLAGPPIKSYEHHRGLTYTEHMPIARATREVVRGECPAGTTYQADGTCLQPGTIGSSSYSYSYSGSHSSGGTVWTGGSEHFNESTGQYEYGWRKKHKKKAHHKHRMKHHKYKAYKAKRGCHARKSHTVYDYESASRCN